MRYFSAVVAACLTAGLTGCSGTDRALLLTVSAVTPTTFAAGSGGTVLTVTGTQFNANMTVLLGTTALPTTFVSSTTLTATVPATLVGGSYIVSIRDNGSTYVAAAVYATTLTVQATNPAPVLLAASPSAFLTGGTTASTTVTGSGFVSGTTATIDGNTRKVAVQDSTHLTVTLTSDDLLFATTRQLVVTNPAPGGGSTAAATLNFTDYTKAATKYAAYGDSITYGYGVIYPDVPYGYLLAAANSLSFADHGATGDQACDTLPKRLYPAGDEYTTTKGQVYSYMVGTNETYYKGVGAYEAVYNTCDQAVMSWLALSRVNKIIAGDTALVSTGGCSAKPDPNRAGALYCASTGAITTTLQTFGSPIYLWYVIDDAAPAAAMLQVSVDGSSIGAYPTQVTPAISTLVGSTQSIALLRIPIAAGTHSIVATAPTGSAGVLGVGTVPASRSALSFLVVGDVPFQKLSNPKATVATQVQYAADARANAALLISDGLDLRWAPTRLYMLGTDAEMSDQLHPNGFGHTHLQAAFQTGFTNLNASNGPYAAAVLKPSVALDNGGENVLPLVPIATVQPTRAGTTYRIPGASADLVTVANTTAQAQTATLLAPTGESIAGAAQGFALLPGEVVTLSRSGSVWTALRTPATGAKLTPAQP